MPAPPTTRTTKATPALPLASHLAPRRIACLRQTLAQSQSLKLGIDKRRIRAFHLLSKAAFAANSFLLLAVLAAALAVAPVVAADDNQSEQATNDSQRLSRRAASVTPRSVLETDLLPFSAFFVKQPTFDEIIKTWPPSNARSSHQQSDHQHYPQHQHHQHHHHNHQQQQQQPLANRLNEDIDDSIASADEDFERDVVSEPATHVNYLRSFGDFVYSHLRAWAQPGATHSPAAVAPPNVSQDALHELLDDFYYDQYQNSQVLYYGAQLAREGELVEIGCYAPLDARAVEWTKSGRPLDARLAHGARVTKRVFSGAKLNVSLKIFEASQLDTGNYRCSGISRKFHKLIVVPASASHAQLYRAQQRLLTVVKPALASPPSSLAANAPRGQSAASAASGAGSGQPAPSKPAAARLLPPAFPIVERRPLVVQCNISDELALRSLAANPEFQLAWYRNGRLLRGAPLASSRAPTSHLQQLQQHHSLTPVAASSLQQAGQQPQQQSVSASQRVQFRQANGRQLVITSMQLSDAGDYYCSWAKLPVHALDASTPPHDASGGLVHQAQLQKRPTLESGQFYRFQLMTPVKLRPFKSAYSVRDGDELRLACQAQAGFPAPHFAWFIGNRLVDEAFIRESLGALQLLTATSAGQFLAVPSEPAASATPASDPAEPQPATDAPRAKLIVEINPIPANRVLLQQTTNGAWLEYRDSRSERFALDSNEKRRAFALAKLAQLAVALPASSSKPRASSSSSPAGEQATTSAPASSGEQLPLQASASVLVVGALASSAHSTRFACRAVNRVSTDEVTTVIKVQATSTIIVQPSTGKATLIPGQALHFECGMLDQKDSQFKWYRKSLNKDDEELLDPSQSEETLQIHNERLSLLKPTSQMAGDYICRALKSDKSDNLNETATIQVRMAPQIEDFGIETSHTGKSTLVTDGERFEMTCQVRDSSAPVNITWFKSTTPDDDSSMTPLTELPQSSSQLDRQIAADSQSGQANDGHPSTYIVPQEPSVYIELIGKHAKKLVIESVTHAHRSYYICMADNGVTERTRKMILVRVQDKLVALWPMLGVVAELVILFAIIYIWDTERAYKELSAGARNSSSAGASKRQATGVSSTAESVPLTSGGC